VHVNDGVSDADIVWHKLGAFTDAASCCRNAGLPGGYIKIVLSNHNYLSVIWSQAARVKHHQTRAVKLVWNQQRIVPVYLNNNKVQ